MKVVGMSKFQYTSKKSGKTYPAANLYCTEERNNVVGVAAFNLFVKAELVPGDVQIGSEISCSYNRFGSVEEIRLVK